MSQVIYRRFRPNNFNEIFGQVHIVNSLKDSIIQDNLSHAYLFSGPRGTGKTTTARIFAKTVNIGEIDYDIQNEVSEAINEGKFMDLVEIDAASSRGVEEIRQLRDSVNFLPLNGKYKIYIIDEAHMLTREAFNALLKTLEEPPEHVIIILATTEPTKIPETVMSRVVHYRFSLASKEEIFEKQKFITDRLKINVSDQVYDLLYELGAGSFRDTESYLSKLISSNIDLQNYPEVVNVLGLTPISYLSRFSYSFELKDAVDVRDLLIEIETAGYDINQFINQLIRYQKNILRTDISKFNKRLVLMLIKFQSEARNVEDPYLLLITLVIDVLGLEQPKDQPVNKKVETKNIEDKIKKNQENTNNNKERAVDNIKQDRNRIDKPEINLQKLNSIMKENDLVKDVFGL